MTLDQASPVQGMVNIRVAYWAPGQYYVVAMDIPGMLPPEIILKVGAPVTVADGATSTNLKLTTRDELAPAMTR